MMRLIQWMTLANWKALETVGGKEGGEQRLKMKPENKSVFLLVSLLQHKRPFTLEEFGVDEQLQREEKHHQDDAGHQDAVEAGAEQTHLPQGHSSAAAGLQPVGSADRRHIQTQSNHFIILFCFVLSIVHYRVN